MQAADQGHTVSCQVTAGNGGGNYTISGLATGSYKVGYYPEGVSANYLFSTTTASLRKPKQLRGGNGAGYDRGCQRRTACGWPDRGRVTAAATHAPLGSVEACAEEASAEI